LRSGRGREASRVGGSLPQPRDRSRLARAHQVPPSDEVRKPGSHLGWPLLSSRSGSPLRPDVNGGLPSSRRQIGPTMDQDETLGCHASPHLRRHLGDQASTATGIRTRVSAMRGRRPSPLDDSGAKSIGSRLAKRPSLGPGPSLLGALEREPTPLPARPSRVRYLRLLVGTRMWRNW
jgi:hypothetical protein